MIVNPASDIQIKGIKRKRLYHILEPHELQKLYNDFKAESPKQRRNKVMFGLIVNQGLKTEELDRLKVKDVNLRTGKLNVIRGKQWTRASARISSNYGYV